MNERIKELIKQATNPDYDSDDGPMNELNVEKFAELIVRECTSLFDGTKEMKTVGMLTHNQVVEQIKKHFGVEE